jgi:hypothetical protein
MPHDKGRLEEALRNADAAGDVEAARAIAAEIRKGAFVGPTLFQARTNPQDYAPVSPALSGAPRQAVPTPGSAPTRESYARFLEQMKAYKEPKGLMTTGGELQDFAAGMGKAATDLWLGGKQMLGMASFEDAANKRALDEPLMATPAGRVGQVAGNVAVAAPSAFIPGAGTVVGGALIGGGLGALQPTEQAGQRPINTAVGAAVGGAANYIGNRIFNPRPTQQVPSIDEIKAAKNAAYDAADASNQIVPLQRIGEAIPKIENMLRDEAFDPVANPMTSRALETLYDDATNPRVYGQTLKGVESIRRRLLNFQNTAKFGSPDARLMGKVVDEFDDTLDELVPYGEARSLYHTLRKAQDIEALFEKARNAAGGYTQSGFENTLRIQFRQLADNAKRFNRFNAEERAAILKVVRGGPIQSLVRFFGKFAARGPVSAMATGLLGNAIGGPGGAMALGAMGEGAKLASGQMRASAAESVSELVRSGALRSVPATGAATASRIPSAAANALSAETVNYLNASQQKRLNALAR